MAELPEDHQSRPPPQPAPVIVTPDVVDSLVSPDGWAYASTPPVEPGDPGRFHALFGRDSLIFALQMLPSRPDIAAATLRSLAAMQGSAADDEVDEQPGKILHEYRPVAPTWLVDAGWPVRDGGIRYYGSSDSTSWFLVVLAASQDVALQAELATAWASAGRWLEDALERGNGLVRFGPRRHPGGLGQQGWRDALDQERDGHGGGIVGEDGAAPAPPVADADSQAAAVAALRAMVTMDVARAVHWSGLLARLRQRIAGSFPADVMAVDAADVPVPGAGSQLGWLLWSGALDGASARVAADRLMQPDIFTAFGLRTLSAEHPAFRFDGYHRGGIWPFDNWIAWGGLRRCHRYADADLVRTGVLDALAQLGRFPELYGVTLDQRLISLPVANRVQAWTVGAVSAWQQDWDGGSAFD